VPFDIVRVATMIGVGTRSRFIVQEEGSLKGKKRQKSSKC